MLNSNLEKPLQSTIGKNEFIEYLNLVGEGLEGLEAWEADLKSSLEDRRIDAVTVFNANPFTESNRKI